VSPVEQIGMQICDICRKTVTALRPGPPELQPLEICEECLQDLLRRLSIIEKRLAETRQQLRAEVLADWKRERRPKGGAV
jgi:hypothetical protein